MHETNAPPAKPSGDAITGSAAFQAASNDRSISITSSTASKSKRLRWDSRNLVSLCVDHHRLEHAGVISISGNADDEIIVTGDTDLLKFRL